MENKLRIIGWISDENGCKEVSEIIECSKNEIQKSISEIYSLDSKINNITIEEIIPEYVQLEKLLNNFISRRDSMKEELEYLENKIKETKLKMCNFS